MATTSPTPDKPGRWVITEFGPPSVLKWQPFESLPSPDAHEVRVRITVAGISGADNLQRAGGYPAERCSKPGFSPGYDIVGTIDAIGPHVTTHKPGDVVASMCITGGYASHIVLHTSDLLPLHPSDDPVKACALPLNYMTAYGMLFRCGVALPPGSSVLIGSAAGGVGTAIAQLARAFDMRLTLFGTCSAGKFEYVRGLGVTPIDRDDEDIPARVRELNGGRGVTVAYDAVGSLKTLADSHAATEEGTRAVRVIGVMSVIAADGSGMSADARVNFGFIEKTPRMEFFAVTGDYYYAMKETFVQDFERILQAVRDGKLDPYIGKLSRLSDAVEVNEMLVSGVGVLGKMEFLVDAELAKSRMGS